MIYLSISRGFSLSGLGPTALAATKQATLNEMLALIPIDTGTLCSIDENTTADLTQGIRNPLPLMMVLTVVYSTP